MHLLLMFLMSLLGAKRFYLSFQEPFSQEKAKRVFSGSNFLKGPSRQIMVKKQGEAFARQGEESVLPVLDVQRNLEKKNVY